jgi:hypothetical protein
MTVSLVQRLCLLVLALVLTLPAAFAKNDGFEVTHFGHDIRIGADQKAA